MPLSPEQIRLGNEIMKGTQPKSVPVKPVVNTTKEEPSFIKTLMSFPFTAPYQSNPITAIKDFLNYNPRYLNLVLHDANHFFPKILFLSPLLFFRNLLLNYH